MTGGLQKKVTFKPKYALIFQNGGRISQMLTLLDFHWTLLTFKRIKYIM